MSAWVVPGYAEERLLGRGASGRVVAAVNMATGQRVAIKYLSPALLRDAELVAGFRSEAGLLRSIAVPQVVRMLGYVEEPGRGAAIIMELVSGVSLHAMITRQGPASPEAALTVLKGSLLGLAAAHGLGIVHRDYKPENVLVEAGGNSKLSDFGVAVRAGRRVPAAGTPLYMAPEQWLGAPATPASDIYAATAVFFECLTGRTPFPGPLGKLERQHAYDPVPVEQVPEPLRGLIVYGMAKGPDYRPASALAFLASLEATAVAAYGPDWEARGRAALRDSAAAMLLLGASAVGAGTGLASVATWLARHKPAAIAGAVVGMAVVAGVATTAVALTGGGGHRPAPHPTTQVESSLQPTRSAGPSGKPSGAPTRTATARGAASVKPTGGGSPSGNNGGGHLTLAAMASASPSSGAVDCSAGRPAVTFSGSVTASQATTVTYYWQLPDGNGPNQTLSFHQAGTQQVAPATLQPPSSPPAGDYTGSGAIVIISPQSVTSDAAAFDLSCAPPKISLALETDPASPVTGVCGQIPAIDVIGNIDTNQDGTVTYQWTRSDGTSSGPMSTAITASATNQVIDPLDPPQSGGTLTDTLEITAPVSLSLSATVNVTCTPPLSITTGSLPSGYEYANYSATVSATGGDGSYQWSATGLPSGLSIDSGTGTISGSSQTTGTFPVTITVTDGESPTPHQASTTLNLAIAPPPIY